MRRGRRLDWRFNTAFHGLLLRTHFVEYAVCAGRTEDVLMQLEEVRMIPSARFIIEFKVATTSLLPRASTRWQRSYQGVLSFLADVDGQTNSTPCSASKCHS